MRRSDVPRVVIVGGGFAGLNVARRLRKAPVEVVVIDRRNHHLFQPLLYQVATGALSPADVSAPIRGLLRNQKNARVLLGEVTGVHVAGRRVVLEDGEEPYDFLVLATGSEVSYFGNDGWREWASGLKTLDDATAMRSAVLRAFEAAERASSPEERTAWMTFVIVGGGPTGIELAGALTEMAHHTLRRDFRAADPRRARIILVEGGGRLLPAYREALSRSAERAVERLGAEVRKGTKVVHIAEDAVVVESASGQERMAARTVLWAAGMSASPVGRSSAEQCGAEIARDGRVVVEPDFSVAGHPEVFVAGDLAAYSHIGDGRPMRGTADVAIAQGRFVGEAIRRRVSGRPPRAFRFRDRGMLAVIGRSTAVVDLFGRVSLRGRIGWYVWLFVHILYLVGFQNRMTVLVQWAWSYFTRNRSARLITGPVRSPFVRRRGQ